MLPAARPTGRASQTEAAVLLLHRPPTTKPDPGVGSFQPANNTHHSCANDGVELHHLPVHCCQRFTALSMRRPPAQPGGFPQSHSSRRQSPVPRTPTLLYRATDQLRAHPHRSGEYPCPIRSAHRPSHPASQSRTRIASWVCRSWPHHPAIRPRQVVWRWQEIVSHASTPDLRLDSHKTVVDASSLAHVSRDWR